MTAMPMQVKAEMRITLQVCWISEKPRVKKEPTPKVSAREARLEVDSLARDKRVVLTSLLEPKGTQRRREEEEG